MIYELVFDPRAMKEWRKLGESVRQQFKKKLADVVVHPRNESARLHHLPNCYRIKLRSAGFRLVYQVQDEVVTVLVIAIGKREKALVYGKADDRLAFSPFSAGDARPDYCCRAR